ncbi:FAT4 [Branchiostoma lanceolatum]|uniref:FAT4 protein n=1 Tax=Branchiostoma lanceolatum TaxID=7740 RepID=A0A8K0EB60_BRALA|nr:FAT4 [Branchiostoma lanceolatum]
METDECSPDPCTHGTCQDLAADYACHCQHGFIGRNCDHPVPECLGPLPEDASPWQHNLTGSVVTVEWGYAKGRVLETVCLALCLVWTSVLPYSLSPGVCAQPTATVELI